MNNYFKFVINNVKYNILLTTIVKANVENTIDERLELVELSKGLRQILQVAGFTVEKILENGPSQIAETLGIDVYIGEIIYNETKKSTSNVNSIFLININY